MINIFGLWKNNLLTFSLKTLQQLIKLWNILLTSCYAKPVERFFQINMHFMLAITGCNYCGRQKTLCIREGENKELFM